MLPPRRRLMDMGFTPKWLDSWELFDPHPAQMGPFEKGWWAHKDFCVVFYNFFVLANFYY